MTGRQSVPGLKGPAASDPLLGSWLVPSSPFSCQVLGVYEEQSEKLAPRPHGAPTAGTLCLLGARGPFPLPSQILGSSGQPG